jgi:hypothetical protein
MLKILPYKRGSKSAKALSEAIGGSRLLSRSPVWGEVVLNWGNSKVDFPITGKMFNLPVSVALAANKIRSLEEFRKANVPCPEFSTDPSDAEEWLDAGHRVVVRHLIKSHSGNGVEIVEPGEYLPDAPLYTKYLKKKQEFRVHIFYGQVIDFTEKKAKLEKDHNYNPYVRNHKNGWVFCRDNVILPEQVKDVAKRAVAALKLDFGAADVIFRNGKAWALEVNTAPGLEGLTLDQYVIALEELKLV